MDRYDLEDFEKELEEEARTSEIEELFRDDMDRFSLCGGVTCCQALTRELHEIRGKPNLKAYTRSR
jgi:hypothetical protein